MAPAPAPVPAPAPSTALPPQATAAGRAALILVDQAGLAPPEEQALRGIAETELTGQGFALVTDPRFDLRTPVDVQTVQLAQSEGAQRVFVLEARGRLGAKIPMVMEEVGPDARVVLGSVSSISSEIEEGDVTVPRLVRATLGRQSAASTAEIDSVTYNESKPFQKKPGEKFFMIGLELPAFGGGGNGTIYGYSMAFFYEADIWRVGGTVEGGGHNDLNEVFTGIEGAWIPLKGEFSPYLGGGIGFMGTTANSGLGLKIAGGVEAFRLHGVRAMVGLDLHIPLFKDNNQQIYPLVGIRFAF